MPVQRGRSFFESPQITTYLLMTANVVIFGLCLRYSNNGTISPEILWRNGAMYSGALANHEYWRLVAAGFLHANIIHLATNMLCLALWGGHLERRVGPFYFVVLYLGALIAGSLVGSQTHVGPYFSVGASGAISGILGALLCLRLLGKVDLPASFFAINIGLNIALGASASSIDWGAHLGGFVAGLVLCAALEGLERVNSHLLRCKFPEFIKLNGFVLAVVPAALLWGNHPATVMAGGWLMPLAYLITCLIAVKAIDIVLSLKKGLAVIVIALATGNAALAWFVSYALRSEIASSCAARRAAFPFDETVIGMACSNVGVTTGIMATVAFVLTILLYSQELYRGIKDIGFVGNSLRAERGRRRGL